VSQVKHADFGDVTKHWDEHWEHEAPTNALDDAVQWIFRDQPWTASSIYAEQMRRIAGVRSGSTLLEAGTGSGKIAIMLALRINCRVVCLDASEKALSVASEVLRAVERRIGRGLSVEFVQADFTQYRSADRFDCVFNEGVLEHWFEPEPIIDFLRRMAVVTRPGGYVMTWVPSRNVLYGIQERWLGFEPPVDQRPLSARELRRLMRAAGLRDIETAANQPYLTPFLWPTWIRPARALGLPFWALGQVLPAQATAPIRFALAHEVMGAGLVPVRE
jgi:2-polyprenyl-3-methyl-5-hydroxy-6-metoxy-1,4-benzoquinol methylase